MNKSDMKSLSKLTKQFTKQIKAFAKLDIYKAITPEALLQLVEDYAMAAFDLSPSDYIKAEWKNPGTINVKIIPHIPEFEWSVVIDDELAASAEVASDSAETVELKEEA